MQKIVIAQMEMFVLLTVEQSWRAELKYALMGFGVLSLIMIGITKLPLLYAGNSICLLNVSQKFIDKICCEKVISP